VTLNTAGSASITPADVNNGSFDNCAVQSLAVNKTTFGCANIGANAVTLTVTDVNGNVNTCGASVLVVGLIPTCSIASIPSSTYIGASYTGGVPTNIYIGYGPQSTTLKTTMLNGTPQAYSWTCSNPLGLARLSCTNCAAPVFTPLVTGNYTFTVTITNNYGCVTTCTITICVLDITDGGIASGKVFMAHYPNGTLPCGPGSMCNTLSISVNAIPAHLAHTCDHLGKCSGSGQQICAPVAKTDEDADADRIIEGGNAEFNVRVHPNPFSSQFHLSVSSSSEDNLEIKIFDVLGQMIENRTGIAFETDITLGSKLSKGVYLVEVTQGSKTQVLRIVKAE